MKGKFWITTVLAAASLGTVSAGAFAHGGDHDDPPWEHEHHHRHPHWSYGAPQPVYVAPRVVYPAPPVIYRQPVVYRPAPTPVYYAAPVPYPPRYDDRLAAQAIGTVAGGIIGHQVGDGRLAPTLIGAVVGGVVGSQLAGY